MLKDSKALLGSEKDQERLIGRAKEGNSGFAHNFLSQDQGQILCIAKLRHLFDIPIDLSLSILFNWILLKLQLSFFTTLLYNYMKT